MRNLPLLTLVIGSLLVRESAGEGTPSPLPAPVKDADYHDAGAPPAAKVEVGRLLFFDKILSGNRNIACATCHHPRHATSDGVALGFGEGARGLGPKRRPGRRIDESVHERVPRNSPALFNLGAREYTTMFHDGRVEIDTNGYYESGFISPARWKLPKGLDNVLAAQAMFPVTSQTEMAGQKGENEIADSIALNRAAGSRGAWEKIARRLRANREYVRLFKRAFPQQIRRRSDITYVHAANAIAAFENQAFRADRSPFDAHLRGERELEGDAREGMELFYGRAQCASCHSGKFQTDHRFHSIAMPQIGPGKGDGRDASYWDATGIPAFVEDNGRERVTGREEDTFKFRTPSLRNVELTGPWGHAGTHTSLEAVIRHHANPVGALRSYEVPDGLLTELDQVVELSATADRMRQSYLTPSRLAGYRKKDTWILSQDALRESIAESNDLDPVRLTEGEIRKLVAFLKSLTDPRSRNLDSLVPQRVPSGLPVAD